MTFSNFKAKSFLNISDEFIFSKVIALTLIIVQHSTEEVY